MKAAREGATNRPARKSPGLSSTPSPKPRFGGAVQTTSCVGNPGRLAEGTLAWRVSDLPQPATCCDADCGSYRPKNRIAPAGGALTTLPRVVREGPGREGGGGRG